MDLVTVDKPQSDNAVDKMVMQTQTTNKTSLNLSKEEIILVEENNYSKPKTRDHFTTPVNATVTLVDSVYESSAPQEELLNHQQTLKVPEPQNKDYQANLRQNSLGSGDYEQSSTLAPVQQVVAKQIPQKGGIKPTIEPIIVSVKQTSKSKPPNTSQGSKRPKILQNPQSLAAMQMNMYLSNSNNEQITPIDTGEQQTFASLVEDWASKETSAGAQTAPWSRQQPVRGQSQLRDQNNFSKLQNYHPEVSTINFGPFQQFAPPNDLRYQQHGQIVQPRKAVTRNCAREKQTIESILADTQSSNLPPYPGQQIYQVASQGRYIPPVARRDLNISNQAYSGQLRAGSMQPFVSFEEFSDFHNLHSSVKQSEQVSDMQTPKPLYTLTLQKNKNVQKNRLAQTDNQRRTWNVANEDCNCCDKCMQQVPPNKNNINFGQRLTSDATNFRQSVQQPSTIPLFGQTTDGQNWAQNNNSNCNHPHQIRTEHVSQDESNMNYRYQTMETSKTCKDKNKHRYCSISPSIHCNTQNSGVPYNQDLPPGPEGQKVNKNVFSQGQQNQNASQRIKKRAKTRLESLGNNTIKIGSQPGAMIRQETRPFIKKRSLDEQKNQLAMVQDSICNPDYIDYQTTGFENSIDANILLQQNSEFFEESAIFSTCNEGVRKVKGSLEMGQSIYQGKEKAKGIWGAESVNKKLKKLYGDLMTNQIQFNSSVENDSVYTKKPCEFVKLVSKQSVYLEKVNKETCHMFLPREQRDCMREVDLYYQGMIKTMSTYIERQDQKFIYNAKIQQEHIGDLQATINRFFEQQRKAQQMMDSVNKDIEGTLKIVDQYDNMAQIKDGNMSDTIFALMNNINPDGQEREIDQKLRQTQSASLLVTMTSKMRQIFTNQDVIKEDYAKVENTVKGIFDRLQHESAVAMLRILDLKKPIVCDVEVQVTDEETARQMQEYKMKFISMTQQVNIANENAAQAMGKLGALLRQVAIVQGERDRTQELYNSSRFELVEKEMDIKDLEQKLMILRTQLQAQMQKEINVYIDQLRAEKLKNKELMDEMNKMRALNMKLENQVNGLSSDAGDADSDFLKLKKAFELNRKQLAYLLPFDPATKRQMTVSKKQIIMAIRYKLAITLLRCVLDKNYLNGKQAKKVFTKEEQKGRGLNLAEKIMTNKIAVVKKAVDKNEKIKKLQTSRDDAHNLSLIESDLDYDGVSKGIDTVHRNSIETMQGLSQKINATNEEHRRGRSKNPANLNQLTTPKNRNQSQGSSNSIIMTPMSKKGIAFSIETQTDHSGPIAALKQKKLKYQYPSNTNAAYKMDSGSKLQDDQMPIRSVSYLSRGVTQNRVIPEAYDSDSDSQSLDSDHAISKKITTPSEAITQWTKMKVKKTQKQILNAKRTSNDSRSLENDYQQKPTFLASATKTQNQNQGISPPRRGQAGSKLLDKIGSSLKKKAQMSEVRVKQIQAAEGNNDTLSFGNQTVSYLNSARSQINSNSPPQKIKKDTSSQMLMQEQLNVNNQSPSNSQLPPQIQVAYHARSININMSKSPPKDTKLQIQQVQSSGMQMNHGKQGSTKHGKDATCLACLIEEYQMIDASQHLHANVLKHGNSPSMGGRSPLPRGINQEESGNESSGLKAYQSRYHAPDSNSPKRATAPQKPRTISDLKNEGLVARDMSPDNKLMLLQPTIVHSQIDRDKYRKDLAEEITKLKDKNQLKDSQGAQREILPCNRHVGVFMIQNGVNQVDGPTQTELAMEKGFTPSEQIHANQNLQPRTNMDLPHLWNEQNEQERSQSPPK